MNKLHKVKAGSWENCQKAVIVILVWEDGSLVGNSTGRAS